MVTPPLFRGVVDLVKSLRLNVSLSVCKHVGDSGCERRLAVVNVPDRADVYVRFTSVKYLLSHYFSFAPSSGVSYAFALTLISMVLSLEPTPRIELGTSFLPRMRSTTELCGPDKPSPNRAHRY